MFIIISASSIILIIDISWILAFCFFEQKTAYEVRISDWSSDVCSSDLPEKPGQDRLARAWFCWQKLADFLRKIDQNGARLKDRDWLAGVRRLGRSDVSRVGQECVSTCRARWRLYP